MTDLARPQQKDPTRNKPARASGAGTTARAVAAMQVFMWASRKHVSDADIKALRTEGRD